MSEHAEAPGTEPPGIDRAGVTDWFVANVPGTRPPLSFELFGGGNSNLTFAVTDAAGAQYVLRRPPTGHVLPTAHDMEREHRIVSALADSAVPVPKTFGFCADTSVTGAPFYVMTRAQGRVLGHKRDVEGLAADVRVRIGERFIDILADLHAIDPVAAGLGDLGRTDGYVERQLDRWIKQYRTSVERSGAPQFGDVERTYRLLADHAPAQHGAVIAHGDYRIENAVVQPDGEITAILDWELCTLGVPLADLAYTLMWWVGPTERYPEFPGGAPTRAGGFPTSDELADRYAARSGRSLDHLQYFLSFAQWRTACIMHGVLTRYAAGSGGGGSVNAGTLNDRVARLTANARSIAESLA
jgi:aminoglycoside phosphotransferase (APT) family kinase protein